MTIHQQSTLRAMQAQGYVVTQTTPRYVRVQRGNSIQLIDTEGRTKRGEGARRV